MDARKAQADVFLSYNRDDGPAVQELARRLVERGIQPWFDEWNLIPGAPWQEAIEQALGSCATCAVFIGPSGTGPWQNGEMRAAINAARLALRSAPPERRLVVLEDQFEEWFTLRGYNGALTHAAWDPSGSASSPPVPTAPRGSIGSTWKL